MEKILSLIILKEFFKSDIISLLDLATLTSMSEDEFYERPFSWRGRSVIERNVKLYEERKNR